MNKPVIGSGMETRTVKFDIRNITDNADGTMTIDGYAAVTEQEINMGDWDETIKKGAFKRACSKDDVRCLFNHSVNMILGRTTNKTLEVSEDDLGLKIHDTFPDTSYAKDVRTVIKRGDITQMSFGSFRKIMPMKMEM